MKKEKNIIRNHKRSVSELKTIFISNHRNSASEKPGAEERRKQDADLRRLVMKKESEKIDAEKR